jgi:putative hydrolase of the HAD superfamily
MMQARVVLFDVGGPLYDDIGFYRTVLAVIHERQKDVSDTDYWCEYDACRRAQTGQFVVHLITRFVGAGEVARLRARVGALWRYPPEALHGDVRDTLAALAPRVRLGIVANQASWIRETLARDQIAGWFSIWALAGEVGARKPDPRLFGHALAQAGVAAGDCAMVGDRLDDDVLGARNLGIRGIWLLRGEAPDQPTPAQEQQADAVVRSLAELPRLFT